MSLILPVDQSGRPSTLRMKRPTDRRSLSRSAVRALDVMEYFGEVCRPLRAVEIARQLGMHPSTTNQLLKTLVDSAHLQFDARAMTYRPSPRLLSFAFWVIADYGANGWLHGLVRRLSDDTGFVVTLTTPNDLFMQVIDLARPKDLWGERGQRVSIFGSAVGSAYLATLPVQEMKRFAVRARIQPVEITRLVGCLEEIRRDGFADGVSNRRAPITRESMWSIAVAIPQGRLPIPIVLGLSGPEAVVRSKREMLLECLQGAIRT